MTGPLAVIGIDSLDPYLLQRFKHALPTFAQLLDDSPTQMMETIYPADSIPAWMSCFTGLQPTRHGVFYSYDIFDPTLSDLSQIDASHIRGHAFWDYADQDEITSLILFPLMVYPAYELRGGMVCKSPLDKRIDRLRTVTDLSISPSELQHRYNLPRQLHSVWGGFPGIAKCSDWITVAQESHQSLAQTGLTLFRDESWKLFFIYFHTLDIIQHRLWRFFDTADPTYPGSNPLENSILTYYQLFDQLLAKFFAVRPDISYMILSDHGHQRRPVKTVNVNEHLRSAGYLQVKPETPRVLHLLRRVILDVAYRCNLEHWLMHLVVASPRLTQASKSLYSSVNFINMDTSKAYLSTFAGIKSYSHGGIEVNRDQLSQAEYIRLLEALTANLKQLTTPTGAPLFDWIQPRDIVHPGPYSETIYPDLLFQLHPEYGVGWELQSGLYGTAYDHKVASGGHAFHATLLLKNIPGPVRSTGIHLVDLAPTILDLLHVSYQPQQFDGRSLIQ
jgi:predicted AlkP superfamily phosphohydrolase/phosphomutase